MLMEDQASFSGKADPTAYTMAKEHHDIIAKFGRYRTTPGHACQGVGGGGTAALVG